MAEAAIQDFLEAVKAGADVSIIAAIFTRLNGIYSAVNAQLAASSERHPSVLAEAQAQAEKNQLHLHLQAIGKDGEIERLTVELTKLQKSKRQSLKLLQQKDAEIREKNSTIQSYLDKIVVLTSNAAAKEMRLHEIETELSRCHATCSRISLEKEFLEKHNSWLDEKLKAKSNTLSEMRKSNMDSESKMSARIADLERELSESSVSLKRRKERVAELKQRLSYLEKELSKSKEAAAINEQRLNAELATVSKLVELYKESSGEWSKKAGELEGVIKALEISILKHQKEILANSEKRAMEEVRNLSDKVLRFQSTLDTIQSTEEVREMILQAETIQELASTSKELSALQSELAKLRENLDVQKAENENLKASWEHERQELQKERDESMRKYNETNEQAETEISLLKQDKLRLQSELDIAVRASQDAQALLRSQSENAKATMFKDAQALQLQVREINLLRESNIQLREENKKNFDECQKLREEAQKAKIEAESSRNILLEKQIEIEACQKELEMIRIEAENLDNRIKELVESSKIIDPKEHKRIKDELHHIKALLADHCKELEQAKNHILEKEEIVLKLEENLAKCQADLAEHENKLNDVLQVEENLKASWEHERRELQKERDEILRKYNETNEQIFIETSITKGVYNSWTDEELEALSEGVEKYKATHKQKPNISFKWILENVKDEKGKDVFHPNKTLKHLCSKYHNSLKHKEQSN